MGAAWQDEVRLAMKRMDYFPDEIVAVAEDLPVPQLMKQMKLMKMS